MKIGNDLLFKSYSLSINITIKESRRMQMAVASSRRVAVPVFDDVFLQRAAQLRDPAPELQAAAARAPELQRRAAARRRRQPHAHVQLRAALDGQLCNHTTIHFYSI